MIPRDAASRHAFCSAAGRPGAEAAFGACAERYGVEEVNFTFDGHKIDRHRGVRVLNHEELLAGDVSLEYVSRLMHRRYTEGPTLRKVLQTLWYQVNNGQEIYVIGAIQEDDTVRGGTGGAPSSPSCVTSRCMCSTRSAIAGSAGAAPSWEGCTDSTAPVITHPHFTGTGTRTIRDNGDAGDRGALPSIVWRVFIKETTHASTFLPVRTHRLSRRAARSRRRPRAGACASTAARAPRIPTTAPTCRS